MPTLDRSRRRATVRVVFDGPARAGKSTNVARIPGLFPVHRRGEVVTPHPTGGRTDYFDFLEVKGGTVAGLELYGHFLSVPGQDVLFHRRRFLLRNADCIVFVCAATDAGLVEAKRSWRELRRVRTAIFGDDAPPIVVQVNKLDIARPGSMERVLAVLGVPEDVVTIGASASTGEGVRETVVQAFRAAADRAQHVIREVGIDAVPCTLEDANSLLIAMQLHSERPPPGEGADLAPAPPGPDTPNELMWPLPVAPGILRRALSAGPRITEVYGDDPKAVVYESGIWRLSTCTRHRFRSLDDAKAALADLGAAKSALGALTPRSQALAIEATGSGGHAIWTIGPWFTNLRDQLSHAARRLDAEAFEEALAAYGRCLLAAMRVALAQRLVLDLAPEAFAAVGMSIYYVGDIAVPGTRMPTLGEALVGSLGDDPQFDRANETFVAVIEEGLVGDFRDDELETLGVVESLESTTALTVAAESARARWLRAIRTTGARAAVGG